MNRADPSDLPEDLLEAGLALMPGGGAAVPFGKKLLRKMLDERQRRVSVALAAAEQRTGRTREDIEEMMSDDPQLLPLAVRLLYAAGMNGRDETLKLLGSALGEALRDPIRAGDVEDCMEAISTLKAGHIRLLEYSIDQRAELETNALDAVHEQTPRFPKGEEDFFAERVHHDLSRRGWLRAEAISATGIEEALFDVYVGGLVAAGLLHEAPSEMSWAGQTPYEATTLAHHVVAILRSEYQAV